MFVFGLVEVNPLGESWLLIEQDSKRVKKYNMRVLLTIIHPIYKSFATFCMYMYMTTLSCHKFMET